VLWSPSCRRALLSLSVGWWRMLVPRSSNRGG
jgi:hypothetical protein